MHVFPFPTSPKSAIQHLKTMNVQIKPNFSQKNKSDFCNLCKIEIVLQDFLSWAYRKENISEKLTHFQMYLSFTKTILNTYFSESKSLMWDTKNYVMREIKNARFLFFVVDSTFVLSFKYDFLPVPVHNVTCYIKCISNLILRMSVSELFYN